MHGTKRKKKLRRIPQTPSELLIALYQRYPNDPKDQLYERFRDEACEYQEFVESLCDYWFSRNYCKLTAPPRPKRTLQEIEQDKAEALAFLDQQLREIIALRAA